MLFEPLLSIVLSQSFLSQTYSFASIPDVFAFGGSSTSSLSYSDSSSGTARSVARSLIVVRGIVKVLSYVKSKMNDVPNVWARGGPTRPGRTYRGIAGSKAKV